MGKNFVLMTVMLGLCNFSSLSVAADFPDISPYQLSALNRGQFVNTDQGEFFLKFNGRTPVTPFVEITGIVQDDRYDLYSNNFPVTVYGILSNGMTGSALAQLIQAGGDHSNDPIRKYQ